MSLLESHLAAFPGSVRLIKVLYTEGVHTSAHGQTVPCLAPHLGVIRRSLRARPGRGHRLVFLPGYLNHWIPVGPRQVTTRAGLDFGIWIAGGLVPFALMSSVALI